MEHTWDRFMRNEQKAILKEKYPDYDAKHHSIFVDRFNKEIEKNNLQLFYDRRGVDVVIK